MTFKKKIFYKCKNCGFIFDYVPLQGKDWQVQKACDYCGSRLGYKKVQNETLEKVVEFTRLPCCLDVKIQVAKKVKK